MPASPDAITTSNPLTLGDLDRQIATLRRYRDELPPHSESGTRRALDERLASLEARRRSHSKPGD